MKKYPLLLLLLLLGPAVGLTQDSTPYPDTLRNGVSAASTDIGAWRSKRVEVINLTDWPAVEAAEKWSAVSVVNPTVSNRVQNYPAHCPPLDGGVIICLADLGPHIGYASTSVVRGRQGYITAVRIAVNTYWEQPDIPGWRSYVMVHELGHAFAGLPHNNRSTSVMFNGAIRNQYPDAGDAAAMDAAYRRR